MFPNNYLDPSFYDLNAYNAMSNASRQGTDGRAEDVQRSSPPSYRATTYENNSAAADWRGNRSSGSFMENQLRHTWQNHPPSPPVRAASRDTERVGGHHGTAGTCSIRIVDGPDSYGRMIDCIAMVAKVSYEKAKQAAIDIYADYNPAEEGLTFKNAKKVIRKLGLKCERRFDKGKDWKDLPDLAIVAVGENGTRAVVFVRENGQEFICDSSNKEPVSRKDYPHKRDPDGLYIKIISQSHGGSGSSHLGGHSDYPVSHQGYGGSGSSHLGGHSDYPVSHQGYGGSGSSHLGGHSYYPVSPSSPLTKDDSPQTWQHHRPARR